MTHHLASAVRALVLITDRPGRLCSICGIRPAPFFNDSRCEDCYSIDQWRYHGKSLAVRLDKTPRE